MEKDGKGEKTPAGFRFFFVFFPILFDVFGICEGLLPRP